LTIKELLTSTVYSNPPPVLILSQMNQFRIALPNLLTADKDNGSLQKSYCFLSEVV